MAEMIESYWPYLLGVLALILALAAYLFLANRKARVAIERRDVLDEGAEPARRNQALIDAPPPTRIAEPAATTPAPPPAEPPAAPAAQSGEGDDLTRIKGLGPKLAARLAELGVTRFAQIAAWDDSDIERIDAQLGRFQGRIRRDAWVEQAKLLESGDESAFAARFGQNG